MRCSPLDHDLSQILAQLSAVGQKALQNLCATSLAQEFLEAAFSMGIFFLSGIFLPGIGNDV